jgi:hypothetical protein
MLANAPGFRSLYAQREIHFEEVYADILDRAYSPFLRGPVDRNRKKLLDALQKTIDGKVTTSKEEFSCIAGKETSSSHYSRRECVSSAWSGY